MMHVGIPPRILSELRNAARWRRLPSMWAEGPSASHAGRVCTRSATRRFAFRRQDPPHSAGPRPRPRQPYAPLHRRRAGKVRQPTGAVFIFRIPDVRRVSDDWHFHAAHDGGGTIQSGGGGGGCERKMPGSSSPDCQGVIPLNGNAWKRASLI